MKRSLVFSTDQFRPLIDVARAAEEAGFFRAWTTEAVSHDALVRALALGLSTSRLQVASGIAYAFTRHPLGTAATAADIQVATEGRFALGLGAGTKGMRTKRYGITDFDHPARRLGEYVQLVRTALNATEPFAFDGEFYRVRSTAALGASGLERYPPIPLVGSGVNRIMLTAAARSCDIVALHPLASFLPYLDAVVVPALAAAGRPVDVAAWRIAAVDEDVDAARRRVRANLAFYLSTPSYAGVTAGTRWEPVTTRIRTSLQADPAARWTDLADLVPAEMVDEFAVVAAPDEAADQVDALEKQLAERGVGELVFQLSGIGLPEDRYAQSCLDVVAALAD